MHMCFLGSYGCILCTGFAQLCTSLFSIVSVVVVVVVVVVVIWNRIRKTNQRPAENKTFGGGGLESSLVLQVRVQCFLI